MLQCHTHGSQSLSLLALGNMHIGTIEVVAPLHPGLGEQGTIVTSSALIVTLGEEAPGYQAGYLLLAIGRRELIFIEIRKSFIESFHLHIDPCNLEQEGQIFGIFLEKEFKGLNCLLGHVYTLIANGQT